MDGPVDVVLGFGSNLGDRAMNLEDALRRIGAAPWIRIVQSSPVYESAPLGPPQGPYLNAAALVRSSKPLRAVLELALATEQAMGRERRVRWGPRVIDIDLLWSSAPAVHEPGLTVPHPELANRDFALVPLLAVLPEPPEALLLAKARLVPDLREILPCLPFSGGGAQSGDGSQ